MYESFISLSYPFFLQKLSIFKVKFWNLLDVGSLFSCGWVYFLRSIVTIKTNTL